MNVENRTIFEGDNLQLLCGACNSTKGNRTQDELIQSLRDQDVIREDFQEY